MDHFLSHKGYHIQWPTPKIDYQPTVQTVFIVVELPFLIRDFTISVALHIQHFTIHAAKSSLIYRRVRKYKLAAI
jgi:hypothetical protein